MHDDLREVVRCAGGSTERRSASGTLLGTNANDVIAATQREMRAAAKKAVAQALERIDAEIFEVMAGGVAQLNRQVTRWRAVIEAEVTGTPPSRPAKHRAKTSRSHARAKRPHRAAVQR